jgi:hypothetical protein
LASSSDPDDQKNGLLQKIIDVKEVLAAIIVVVGAVFAILAFFATKQELNTLRCITQANLIFLESQMKHGVFSDLLANNLNRQRELRTAVSNEALELEKVRLQVAETDLAAQITLVSQSKSDALEIMRLGKCG